MTVFISYRRETTAGEARALFNDLVARLGKNSVFMDVDSIALGRDFRSVLQKVLESCNLMLVLIDKDWAGAKDERGRLRLEDPGDYVRLEVQAALKRDIVVTPVLVKGAHMPAAEQLPAEIRDLMYRNGFELSHNRWESDVQEMIRRLGLDLPEGGGQIERRPTPMGQAKSKQRHVWVLISALIIAASGVGLLLVYRYGPDLVASQPAVPRSSTSVPATERKSDIDAQGPATPHSYSNSCSAKGAFPCSISCPTDKTAVCNNEVATPLGVAPAQCLCK